MAIIYPEGNRAQSPQIQTPNPMPPKQSFFKQNKWPIIIISISLLVIAGALFAIFREPKNSGPTDPKVIVEIEAPKETPSGSEVIYRVKISNDDTYDINNGILDVIYPTGFTFTDSVPKPSRLNGTQYTLPEISSGQDTVIMIKGTIQGNASEVKTISATLRYQITNFFSDFIIQGQGRTEIITSNVSLDFEGPNSTASGQDITYTVRYSNFLETSINNFRIVVTTPQNFTLKNTEPKAPSGTTWSLGTLQPNQTGSVKLTGSFSQGSTGEQLIFTAKAEGDAGSGSSYVLSAAQYLVEVTSVPLQASLSLISGNVQNSADVVAPGARLQYKISYRNNGTVAAKGVAIVAKLEGAAFDLAQVQAFGASISGNEIRWDGSQNSQLASLQPNQSGDFMFSVQVMNPATKSNVKDISLKVVTQMTSSDFGQPFIIPDHVLKIGTVPQINAAVELSSGANPPKVGQSTTYIATVTLRNASSDISDGVVTLNIPNASSFNGVVAGNQEQSLVNYDQNTKKVTWNVGKLAAHAGTFSPIRRLQFSLTITPAPANANQPLLLVNNIRFSGKDTFTGLTGNITHLELTTMSDEENQSVIKP